MSSHLASQAKAIESQKSLKNVKSVVQLQAKQLSIANKETKTIVKEAIEHQKMRHQVSDVWSPISHLAFQ
jgi:hypothetical protein